MLISFIRCALKLDNSSCGLFAAQVHLEGFIRNTPHIELGWFMRIIRGVSPPKFAQVRLSPPKRTPGGGRGGRGGGRSEGRKGGRESPT